MMGYLEWNQRIPGVSNWNTKWAKWIILEFLVEKDRWESKTVWTDRPRVYYPWNILLQNMMWGVRFEDITVAFLRISVFWDVTLCFQVGSWNKCHAFNPRVKQAKKATLPDPEDKGTIILCNARNCSPHNTVTLLSEAHTLHMSVACSWPAYK